MERRSIFSVLFLAFNVCIRAEDEKANIVGGQEAKLGQFPYQVRWGYNFETFCGGVIYTPITILTAAHCCQEVFEHMDNSQIIASDLKVTEYNGTEQTRGIGSYLIHPEYNNKTKENDICLLFLDSELEFNDYVRNVSLNTHNTSVDTDCIVSGYGVEHYGDIFYPDELKFARVQLHPNEECAAFYGSKYFNGSMICASAKGKDSCQGDSGGPLVCDKLLVGIVSWGIGCANPRYPGIYANVANYQEWVDNNAIKSLASKMLISKLLLLLLPIFAFISISGEE